MANAIGVRWYASGGGIARMGPFNSQKAAFEAMRLTDFARKAQRSARGTESPYPFDIVVWPEESETPKM